MIPAPVSSPAFAPWRSKAAAATEPRPEPAEQEAAVSVQPVPAPNDVWSGDSPERGSAASTDSRRPVSRIPAGIASRTSGECSVLAPRESARVRGFCSARCVVVPARR